MFDLLFNQFLLQVQFSSKNCSFLSEIVGFICLSSGPPKRYLGKVVLDKTPSGRDLTQPIPTKNTNSHLQSHYTQEFYIGILLSFCGNFG